MDKGTLKQFLKGNTTHRFPKIVTLAVTSCVLVTMITIDASASNYAQGNPSNRTNLESTLMSTLSFSQLTGSAGRWHPWLPPVSAPSAPSGGSSTSTTSGQTTSVALSPTTAPTLAPSAIASTASTTTTSTTTTQATTTTQPPQATTTTTTTTTTQPPPTPGSYPVGTPDSTEPSGEAPPAANALSGYTQGYVTGFPGTSLPAGWEKYSGNPMGDPGAMFAPTHLTVSGGLLNINTFQDPAYGGGWVTGGTCPCGISGQTYGAYFVRSRITGPGPTNVELLWPDANVWPPEIDFNETYGLTNATSATVHWGASNSQYPVSLSSIDMTHWHTWGVIWTSTSITYTVDGQVWSRVSNSSAQIPDIPMHLSLQSQTWCASSWACPTAPASLQVNWIAEYHAN